ncbi:MAG TPA: DUF4886 domain-containing protein [Capsulimonadaceae bacterium]|jgi:hypothetical protein
MSHFPLRRRIVAPFACFLLLAASLLTARAEDSVKTLRLLTVGNSFAENAGHYMAGIASAAGYNLVLYRANIGGASMERHWTHVALHEKQADDPKGTPFINPATKKKEWGLKEALESAPWDYVTIQQASINSFDSKSYQPFAKNLYDFIKQHSPKAEVLVYETWPYRVDDPLFAKGTESSDGMYTKLATAYRGVAKDLGARIIPVGDAFHLAGTDPKFTFVVDKTFAAATAVYPALPDQTYSLNVGWWWKKNSTGDYKLQFDGHHANSNGEYLAGLVFVERLTGKSVVGNSFVPPGMKPEIAKALQGYAHQAVQNIVSETHQ